MVTTSILKQRGWNNFVDEIAGFFQISKTSVPKTNYIATLTLL
jgi:hypothetical protein